MNFIERQNLKLWSRNEGKLKSFESCTDIRAWSHDLRSRDRYLREWMKCDMPVRVLPIATLYSYTQSVVSNQNWGRVLPRCHPYCKSKTILESVCKTSAAMKSCLKQDSTFQKYFEQEEFETSHWPCEKCLDVLKNMKMFWKVISNKVFKVRIPPTEICEEHCYGNGDNSLRALVKNWEKDLIHQTVYLKTVTTCSSESDHLPCTKKYSNEMCFKCSRDNTNRVVRNKVEASSLHRKPKFETTASFFQTGQFKGEEENCQGLQNKKKTRQNNKYVTVKIKTAEIGCDSCNFADNKSELEMYKDKFSYIKNRYNEQKCEIDNLKKENDYLMSKLECTKEVKSCNKSTNCSRVRYTTDNIPNWSMSDVKTITILPKNCHSEDDDTGELAKNSLDKVKSEMVITMKTCKNKNYKHISLLQILHKSNDPLYNENDVCCKGDDPSEILNRVKKSFGQIVKREMILVKNKDAKSKLSDINATFQKLSQSSSSEETKMTRTNQILPQAKIYSEKVTVECLVNQCWCQPLQIPKIRPDNYGRSVLSIIANHDGKMYVKRRNEVNTNCL